MILIAVIVGYVLGIAPFVVPKIIEIRSDKTQKQVKTEEYRFQEDILDEYLNGAKVNENNNGVSQEDILKEYLTGETTKGE